MKKWQRAILIIVSVAFVYLALPLKSSFVGVDYSTIVKSENGAMLNAFINNNQQWHFPPDTFKLPEKLISSVIAFEDESFYRHLGINLKAIARAAFHNLKHKQISSGASTIPMQLARMANPKKRTYFNKLREIIYAIKLDLHYSKPVLLKLYLDHAPYGGNVIGYRTAAYKYFGKEANELTWAEAATLAVLPNAPGIIYPAKTTDNLKNKRDALLKKLFDKGHIAEQTYVLARLEPVPDRFIDFEQHAPHLARELRKKYPHQKIIYTTIDEKIQARCNKIASDYRHRYYHYGIHNLAIMISETKTGAVKAYVGSPDFFDFDHGGQVDGCKAPRSSGSVLKPFLFALCIDEGLIIPESLIRDLPTYFEGFSPQNASREYQGVATARESLVQSLNIPSVRLLNAYGVYQFYSFLKAAGVSTLFRTADGYGLPLILGGAEVNMWDMVMLFRGLANEGAFSDNYVVEREKPDKNVKLLSGGSSYLILDMLRDLKRPGSWYYWEKFSGSLPFAWKTGTSYGHKDAWAVGVNPEYTIAVWVGNFNGEGNKNLGGAASAGPVLFDILQILPMAESKAWFKKNQMDFTELQICKLSGFRANEACPEVEAVDVPYGMKPLKACNYHQFRYFSSDSQYQSCSRCWGHVGAIKKSVTIYPPDVAYYIREKGQYVEKVAGHYPHCPAYKADKSLKIIYPNRGAKLFLPRDFNGKVQPVVCRAGHNTYGTQVFWYLGNHYLGATMNDHKMSVIFNEGWNVLKIVDENGALDSQRVFATMRKD